MKKDNEKGKINKLKEFYNNYREARKDPRKKAGMKLLGYLIFFLIIILIANISNELQKSNTPIKDNNTTTTKKVDRYVEKQEDLLSNKYNINYTISYNNKIIVINGTIENNIITGYLETESIIKKITIKNNILYDEKEGSELEIDFDINNLDLNRIINSIKQTSAFINEKDNIKTYLYELDNKKIYIECNEEYIVNIKVEENENIYTMVFDK